MLTIVIEDVNDNDPVFDEVVEDFIINENVNDTNDRRNNLGYVSAFDADGNKTITYTIDCFTCDDVSDCVEDEIGYVSINSATGLLRMVRPIDYELVHYLNCDITATDNGEPERSSTITVIIIIF